MARFETFEDIPVWQESRELVALIYKTTRTSAFSKDRGLCDQIQRAAVSAMTNIAEGFERKSVREFRQFLNYAKASAGETRSLLYVAKDTGYIDTEVFTNLHNKAQSISKSIAGFSKYLSTLN